MTRLEALRKNQISEACIQSSLVSHRQSSKLSLSKCSDRTKFRSSRGKKGSKGA